MKNINKKCSLALTLIGTIVSCDTEYKDETQVLLVLQLQF
jgi:hypothetical protein